MTPPSRIRRIFQPVPLLLLAVGFGLGFTGAWFAGGAVSIRNSDKLDDFFGGLLSFQESTALRAYDNASPKIALWAFHDYIDFRDRILTEKPRLHEYEYDNFAFFYARLSILAGRTGDERLEADAMKKALRRATESGIPFMQKLNTPEPMLATVKRLDDFRLRGKADRPTTSSLRASTPFSEEVP